MPFLGTGRPEVGCDECFELLDQYVDAKNAGSSNDQWRPLEAHLQGCPVCHEEYESLLALTGNSPSETA
jgi:hypothetical protein